MRRHEGIFSRRVQAALVAQAPPSSSRGAGALLQDGAVAAQHGPPLPGRVRGGVADQAGGRAGAAGQREGREEVQHVPTGQLHAARHLRMRPARTSSLLTHAIASGRLHPISYMLQRAETLQRIGQSGGSVRAFMPAAQMRQDPEWPCMQRLGGYAVFTVPYAPRRTCGSPGAARRAAQRPPQARAPRRPGCRGVPRAAAAAAAEPVSATPPCWARWPCATRGPRCAPPTPAPGPAAKQGKISMLQALHTRSIHADTNMHEARAGVPEMAWMS